MLRLNELTVCNHRYEHISMERQSMMDTFAKDLKPTVLRTSTFNCKYKDLRLLKIKNKPFQMEFLSFDKINHRRLQ